MTSTAARMLVGEIDDDAVSGRIQVSSRHLRLPIPRFDSAPAPFRYMWWCLVHVVELRFLGAVHGESEVLDSSRCSPGVFNLAV